MAVPLYIDQRKQYRISQLTRSTLVEQQLRELAEEHLVPLFSRAVLLPHSEPSTSNQQCVAFADPCHIQFKVERGDLYRLVIQRSQAFSQDTARGVTEKNVVEAFVEVVRELGNGLAATYRADLLSNLERRVLAKAIGGFPESVLLAAVDQLAHWATRLYEGRPITAAIGFVPEEIGDGPFLSEIAATDFSSVLSNGFDTLLKFDSEARLLGYEALSEPDPLPPFAPYRQGAIADWSAQGKVGLILNRLGEILIFKEQKLLLLVGPANGIFLPTNRSRLRWGDLRIAILGERFMRVALTPPLREPVLVSA